MKHLSLLLLFLAGCSRPAPVAGSGWEALAWKYTGLNGKTCANVGKGQMKYYRIDLLGSDGKVMVSESFQFDSDGEMNQFVESVCAKR